MEIAFAPSITSFIPKKIDQISVQSGLEAQLDIFLTLLFRLDELVNVRESQNCSDNGKNSDPNGKASPGYATSMSCSSVTFSDFHRTYWYMILIFRRLVISLSHIQSI